MMKNMYGIDHGGTSRPEFMRRDATRGVIRSTFRGLKPTATIMKSLRDRVAAAAIQTNLEDLAV